MTVTTLVLSFLLSFLPLVIGIFSFRYAANFFSRSILILSSASFFLGLAQSSLILGLSYRLFSAARHGQATAALQYVTIAGGSIMIVAGLLWVGYFQMLMKEKAAMSARPAKTPAPAPQKRPKRTRASDDWFMDELPGVPAVTLAAQIAPAKKRVRRSMREVS